MAVCVFRAMDVLEVRAGDLEPQNRFEINQSHLVNTKDTVNKHYTIAEGP